MAGLGVTHQYSRLSRDVLTDDHARHGQSPGIERGVLSVLLFQRHAVGTLANHSVFDLRPVRPHLEEWRGRDLQTNHIAAGRFAQTDGRQSVGEPPQRRLVPVCGDVLDRSSVNGSPA